MKTFCIRSMMLLQLGCFSLAFAQESTNITDSNPPESTVEQDSLTDEPTSRRAPRVTTKLTDDTPLPAEEEESGFKWPSFPKPKMPALPKPSLPKLSLPSWTTAKEMPRETMRHTEEPSTWEKFSSGTKSMFTKTKQTLMSWAQEEEAPPVRRPVQPPRRTPTKTASRAKSKTSSTTKKSLFPWLSKKEEEPPVRTVNDFLAQPRPGT